MNFMINSNGNDANDIRDQFTTLNELIDKVDMHQQSMDYTHGRNYQTLAFAEEAQKADVQERLEIADYIRAIKQFAMKGAAQAIRQREGL